jgi:hypothetical protein
MVEIHVAVADATVAQGLFGRLERLIDRSSVSYDGSRNEIGVRAEWESRDIGRVIETVESWLSEESIASATLSIGERSYTMTNPGCPATPSWVPAA